MWWHKNLLLDSWKDNFSYLRTYKISCFFVCTQKEGYWCCWWSVWSCLQNRNILVAHPLHHQDKDSKQETENGTNTFVIHYNKATAAALSSYMSLYESIRAFQHLAKSWRFYKDPAAQDLEENILFMGHKENACLCQSWQKMTNKRDSHKQKKIRLKSNKNTVFANFI